jgi:hypothetical protein
MSKLVRLMLEKYGLLDETTHEDRKEIDRIIEERTSCYCDEGIKMLSEEEFLSMVEYVLKKRKKKMEKEEVTYV